MWSSREAASRLSTADRLAAALSSRCRSVRFVVLVGMVILVGDGVGGGELMPLLVDTLLVMALFGEGMWLHSQGKSQRFRASQGDVGRVSRPHGPWVTCLGPAGSVSVIVRDRPGSALGNVSTLGG